MKRKEILPYIEKGYVRATRHPDLPLTIYNYTTLAQYEGLWNEVTRKCRGLVLDDEDNIIVNCPPKFFNHDEVFAPKMNLNKAIISIKSDGYYCSITSSSKYGLIVTSRGSFDSKYALATRKFITPEIEEKLLPDMSYFCELLQDFPGDESIIVARHPNPSLVCWGIRDQQGNEYNPKELSPLSCAEWIYPSELKDYLSQEVEGVVAFNPKTGERVKWKTLWYLERHRLISDFSKKRIWGIMKEGKLVSETIEIDELLPQAMRWERELKQDFDNLWDRVMTADYITSDMTDKELGLLDDFQDLKKYIFLLRKDKDQECLNKIWEAIKPHNVVK